MNLRRMFFHDMGRKFLALTLASLVWWRFNAIIERSEVVALEVFAVERTETDVPGRLQVQAPPGWILSDPSAGEQHSVTFRGPGADVTEFLAEEPPSALYVASFSDPGTGTDRFRLTVPLEDLRWTQKNQALALLDEDATISLTFERMTERNVTLAPGMVPIEGDPAENFQVLGNLMAFEPQTITLSGPKSAIERLVSSLDVAEGVGGAPPTLLEKLNVENMRDDIRREQVAHELLVQDGITMLPAKVIVSVPVRLEDAPPVTFVPDEILPLHRDKIEGDWPFEPSLSPWTAELRNEPGIDLRPDQFTEAWVKEHVTLFVDFREIPEGAPEYDLPVRWTISGLASLEDDAYRRALIIAPQQESDRLIRVTRQE